MFSHYTNNIELYDATTLEDRAQVEFLWALLPRRIVHTPNRHEVQYKEVVWYMRWKDIEQYERTMEPMRQKFSEWTQGTAKYRYVALKDLLPPYGEEMLAYYKNVYLKDKFAYIDDPTTAHQLSQEQIPVEKVINKHVARVLEQDKPRSRKRRIVNGCVIMYEV